MKHTQLENLASREYSHVPDNKVKEELMMAGIPILTLPSFMNTEVKTHYIGILNGFVFYRAWRYWVCDGDMPLEYAEQIYSKYKDFEIRAGGHCGNVKPKSMSHNPVYDKALIDLRDNTKDLKEYMRLSKNIVDDESLPRFVDTYHIDTQIGLNKLAEFIKTHNITTKNNRLSE